MNIVKRSIEIKNPNTPVDRRMSHRKNSFICGISHEAKLPAKTIIDDSISIATEIPSTPTARWMLSGSNHIHEPWKSIGAVSPAARS